MAHESRSVRHRHRHGERARDDGAEAVASKDGLSSILWAAFLFETVPALLLNSFLVLGLTVARNIHTAFRDATESGGKAADL